MIGYVKCFDGNKKMSFKLADNKVLQTYNKIWEKINSLLNTEFDSGFMVVVINKERQK